MNALSIIELVKYALRALTAYLEFKRESYFIDASIKNSKYNEKVREKIIALRNQGTVDATDRADLLMQALQERKRAWERASATYFSYSGGNKNPN